MASKALRAAPILKPHYPFYLANKPVVGDKKHTLPVHDKYTGEVSSHVALATHNDLEHAIKESVKAAPAMKAIPHYERKTILLDIAQKLRERTEELAKVIVVEVGKPINDATAEIGRAVDTFTAAAEEAVRLNGEYLPLDISQRNAGFSGIVKKFPIGPISMISPFNFPLNLVAHKVAPAIAAGCPFVLKPSEKTPVSAMIIGEILASTALPAGAFSIMPLDHKDAETLSKDERFKAVSFTGSPGVGWHIKATAGRKKVLLELGGNAGCIVDDLPEHKLKQAAQRLLFGAFYSGGQSCISVQRIYAHDKIYDQLKKELQEGAQALNKKKGDPLDTNTFLGPLISEGDAIRIEKWVNNAVNGGANVIVGGKRDGRFFDITLLENVSSKAEVYCKEVFGPVAILERFTDFKSAIDKVNDSDFGLQAGVFTTDINKAFYAYDKLEVGGVAINDIPSVRVDTQPYGGIKLSGLGREGLRYTIEEFSEQKIMILKNIGEL